MRNLLDGEIVKICCLIAIVIFFCNLDDPEPEKKAPTKVAETKEDTIKIRKDAIRVSRDGDRCLITYGDGLQLIDCKEI